MKQAQHTLEVATRGRGLYEIGADIADWTGRQGIDSGLLNVFCRHTSAGLTIQENADPDVLGDLEAFFARLVPDGDSLYRHTMEGPDDMPAHVRSALVGVGLSIPVAGGRPALGTWQGVYLYEHRTRAHRRAVVLHLIGE